MKFTPKQVNLQKLHQINKKHQKIELDWVGLSLTQSGIFLAPRHQTDRFALSTKTRTTPKNRVVHLTPKYVPQTEVIRHQNQVSY